MAATDAGAPGDGGTPTRSRAEEAQARHVEVTGWTSWIGFAATMLVLIGAFHAIAGFVGLFKEDYYLVPKRDLLVSVDYTVWGWIHIIFGIVAIITAYGLFLGKMWARVLGVLFAMVSTVTNLAFINAYPLWSVMIIAFNLLLIWALTVHGREMQELF
jgi:hypothetical protein